MRLAAVSALARVRHAAHADDRCRGDELQLGVGHRQRAAAARQCLSCSGLHPCCSGWSFHQSGVAASAALVASRHVTGCRSATGPFQRRPARRRRAAGEHAGAAAPLPWPGRQAYRIRSSSSSHGAAASRGAVPCTCARGAPPGAPGAAGSSRLLMLLQSPPRMVAAASAATGSGTRLLRIGCCPLQGGSSDVSAELGLAAPRTRFPESRAAKRSASS